MNWRLPASSKLLTLARSSAPPAGSATSPAVVSSPRITSSDFPERVPSDTFLITCWARYLPTLLEVLENSLDMENTVVCVSPRASDLAKLDARSDRPAPSRPSITPLGTSPSERSIPITTGVLTASTRADSGFPTLPMVASYSSPAIRHRLRKFRSSSPMYDPTTSLRISPGRFPSIDSY